MASEAAGIEVHDGWRWWVYAAGTVGMYIVTVALGAGFVNTAHVDALRQSWLFRNLVGIADGALIGFAADHRIILTIVAIITVVLVRLAVGSRAIESVYGEGVFTRPGAGLVIQAASGLAIGLLVGFYVELVFAIRYGFGASLAWRTLFALPGLAAITFAAVRSTTEVATAVSSDAIETYGPSLLGRLALFVGVALLSLFGLHDASPAKAAPVAVPQVTSTLDVEGTLRAGASLVSTSGAIRLVLQPSDGNLVLYGRSVPLWSPQLHGVTKLILQADGNLVAYGALGAAWSTGTLGSGAIKLVVQDDGNMVLYAPKGAAVWSSGTHRP